MSLVYPTAERLRRRLAGERGAPADRLRRSYIVETSGCWRWTTALTTSGYGHFFVAGSYHQAHVIVWIAERGTPPIGLEPDHTCRNRWCVNPEHIEWVTHAVNSQRGARSFLSPEQVAMIRLRGKAAGVRAMAREYGVDHSTISRVLAGLVWAESSAEGLAAA